MTIFERAITWAGDLLLVVGVLAGLRFLYIASQSGEIEAPTVALLGIGIMIGAIALCLAAHNWAVRSRMMRRDAE